MGMDIGSAVGDALRGQERWRVGTVSGTSGTKVILTVSGTSYTWPRLSSYSSPTVGDVVVVACTEAGPIVIGKIA